jgi:CAAX prenyl protease-like protein
LLRSPAVAWVLPFALFIALLAAQQAVPVPVWVRFVLPMAAILLVSRPALRGGPSSPFLSALLGVAVFAIWVGPDLLAPAWRHSFLFNNSIVGHPAASTPAAAQTDLVFLAWRVAVSVIAVPILEELFWRGWLMRWLIDRDFENVPPGTYEVTAFWMVAILFASEHGSYWDVGLITGLIYNWWMVRTKNIWDCIVAHAITNAMLAAYVIGDGHWEYWL